MVERGDPGRRGTDHSESYGASIKDSLHRRCLRRRKVNNPMMMQKHTSKKTGKTWMSRPLSISRVMQTFRDQAVRERLQRDEESVPYLLRKHYNLASTGFATDRAAAPCEGGNNPLISIFERMAEGREFA